MKKKNYYLNVFKNSKVIITGSTGFKGSWLSFWLNKLGANVVGIGLKPEKNFILFNGLNLKKKIKQYIFDISNYSKISNVIKREKPDIIFHLAAQSIVTESFKHPIKTINSNVIGSLNLLESMRNNLFNNLIYITSDKCYLNNNLIKNYKEKDTLGGFDNYSASKACAEILFHSYYNSFFLDKKSQYAATARAGNVIGGGDFKQNRIIPDFFKSINSKKKLIIRSPNATRPWQHVLEPLSGYLKLGSLMLENRMNKNLYPSWNFGPYPKNCKTVKEVLKMFYNYQKIKINIKIKEKKSIKESRLLSLSISKSKKELNWTPRLTLEETVDYTSSWYNSFFLNYDLEKITNYQIENFLDH